MENRYQIEAYQRAKKRVAEIKGFYWHLVVYVIVIPVIIFINYKTSWEFKWFWFSTIGWGLGLFAHAFSVFWINGILGRNWEQRKMQQFMKEDNSKHK